MGCSRLLALTGFTDASGDCTDCAAQLHPVRDETSDTLSPRRRLICRQIKFGRWSRSLQADDVSYSFRIVGIEGISIGGVLDGLHERVLRSLYTKDPSVIMLRSTMFASYNRFNDAKVQIGPWREELALKELTGVTRVANPKNQTLHRSTGER